MNKRFKVFRMFLSLIMILILFSNSISLAKVNDGKVINIITINDFHGKIEEDTREKGKDIGISKLISVIKQYKLSYPNSFVVSGGDNYQGSALSNLTYGAPVSEMFKEIGLVASAVGNHELDWDLRLIGKWEKDGGFDYLTSNVIDKRTKKLVNWGKPYKVIEKSGLKIGLIGLSTTKTVYKTLPIKIENYIFEPLKESAEKWVKYLKSGNAPEGKVDAVIALTHVGSYQDKDTGQIFGEVIDSKLTEVEGLDGIVSGDSHHIVSGIVNNVAIVQAEKNGRALGRLSLIFDNKNNLIKVKPEVDLLYNRKSEIMNDIKGDAIYTKYYEKYEGIVNEVVGKTENEISHKRHIEEGVSTLGKWGTEIMRKAAGTQIAVINEGAFRTSISAGEITIGDLYDVLPFDNTLIKMDLKGSQLKKIIENGTMNKEIGWIQISGAKVYYNPDAKFGNKVIEITLDDGTKVDADKVYSVATNDFMFLGGDKYDFSEATNVVNTEKLIRGLLAEHLRKIKEVHIEFEQPFIKLNTTFIHTVREEK